nr:zinc finger, CCHC-type, retrotransposon Gag domain protein [Tanacetum cinerariifolium]
NGAGPSGGGGGDAIPHGIHVWIERFTKLKPLAFRSAATLAEAEDWITHMEKLFQVLGYPDNFKTRLFAFKLEGDALSWYFSASEQQCYEREYGSICQLDPENSGEYMERGCQDQSVEYRGQDQRSAGRNGNDRQGQGEGLSPGEAEAEYAAKTSGTITGILCIDDHTVFALFDTGATHSIISTTFAKKLNMTPTSLIERIIISTPMKNHTLIDHEYVNCPLRFDDRIRPANLLPIHMFEFDARTLISHGCQGFLAFVMDTSLESPNIENLSVVCEFADVFPDELPGLHPAREIEFGIELIHGAEPISKAPYRMAPMN